MASLLHLELLIWIAMVLAALLAMLALSSAARQASLPAAELPEPQLPGVGYSTRTAPDERTVARWSRIVQQSNTAFWTYVSHRSDHRH